MESTQGLHRGPAEKLETGEVRQPLRDKTQEQYLGQVCRQAKTPNGTKEQPGHQDLKRKEAGQPWGQSVWKVLGEALAEAMKGQHAPGSWENSSEQNKSLRSQGCQSSGGDRKQPNLEHKPFHPPNLPVLIPYSPRNLLV